jgi:hypothetical protein
MEQDVQRPKMTTLDAMDVLGAVNLSVKTMALYLMVKLFVMDNAMRIITYNQERIRDESSQFSRCQESILY